MNQCVASTFRLSPDQFKAIVYGKGWTYTTLAEHWGISSVWVSNITRDPNRKKHYDDAVMGLPAVNYLARSYKTRIRIAEAYLYEHGARQKITSAAHRYHAHLCVGTIVSVMEDVGSLATIGMRGCVFQVRPIKGGEEYGIIFENGNYDWFTPDYIDRCVVLSGLEDISAASYIYQTDATLQYDYSHRAFNFHP
jgi:hypothetical protein